MSNWQENFNKIKEELFMLNGNFIETEYLIEINSINMRLYLSDISLENDPEYAEDGILKITTISGDEIKIDIAGEFHLEKYKSLNDGLKITTNHREIIRIEEDII